MTSWNFDIKIYEYSLGLKYLVAKWQWQPMLNSEFGTLIIVMEGISNKRCNLILTTIYDFHIKQKNLKIYSFY